MKPEDLMVGDWVLLWGNNPARVDCIGNVEVYLSEPMEQHELDWQVTYEHIKPIPLTPEILEKNGFEEFDGWRILDMDDAEIRWIGTILEISGSHGNMELPNVQCVHELQNALRLCRIDKEIVL